MNDLDLLINMFFTWENPQSRLLFGLGLSSVLMTILKSDYTGDLFSKLPKKFMSFVPMVIGTLLGLCNGIFDPIHGLYLDTLIGGIVIGSGQIAGYQTIKGFQIQTLISSFLKTAIKVQEDQTQPVQIEK